MPWYKIMIASDADAAQKAALLVDAMEAAWLRSGSGCRALPFFIDFRASVLCIPRAWPERPGTLNRFHTVQCYPPTIAHLSQVIPGPKGNALTPTAV
jgi:hypothetical protein